MELFICIDVYRGINAKGIILLQISISSKYDSSVSLLTYLSLYAAASGFRGWGPKNRGFGTRQIDLHKVGYSNRRNLPTY
eukprot:767945-Hanusia_phi.AAC.15